MERGLKRKLVIGVAGLAVLGGGGAAYAVTKSNDNERQAYLGDVAKRLNVTPQKLNDALKGAFEDRLDAAVKAGRLSQAEADAIKKKVAQGGAPPIGPGFGFGVGPRVDKAGGPRLFHHFGGPVKAGLDAAANYLGLTQKQLVDKLQSGKSLADVAGDQQKSVDGLKSAIKDSVKKDLDADVKAGHLSQSEENDLLGRLDNKLDALVNHKGLLPPPGLGKHREFRIKPGASQNGSFPAPPDAPAPPPGAPII